MNVLLDSGSRTTRAQLELTAPGGNRFIGIGLVRGGPRGMHLPDVAEELALARAFSDLTEELLEAVASDIEADLDGPLALCPPDPSTVDDSPLTQTFWHAP